MYYVGCDLHKKTITMHIVNQARAKIASKQFYCCDMAAIAQWLNQYKPFELAVEATASYEWFLDLVEPLAHRVVLAHPGKLRVIAESTRKSDKLDARVLAEFLALDMIPQAHRPTPRQHELRRVVRARISGEPPDRPHSSSRGGGRTSPELHAARSGGALQEPGWVAGAIVGGGPAGFTVICLSPCRLCFSPELPCAIAEIRCLPGATPCRSMTAVHPAFA